MSSTVAYFSTWRPHGNRVSKTWFSNPYYTYQYHKSPEHIRAYQRRKKKKKTRRTQAVARDLGSAQPRARVAQVARDPWVARSSGRARPRQRAAQAVTTAKEFWRYCCLSFAFFYLAFCLATQKIIKFGSLRFSLRSNGCVLDFLSFFFCVFWLVREAWAFNFF